MEKTIGIPKVGNKSPWGRIQHIDQIASGVLFVSTASHGGIWLSVERRKQVPVSVKKTNFLGMTAWWEEDCDAVKVLECLGVSS